MHVREGLSEAFESGESVTAKVTWLPQGRADDGSEYSRPGSSSGRAADGGRTRYISCTPLLGSDDQVGVWMVVMVENEQVTGALPSRQGLNRERLGAEKALEIPNTPSEYEREDNSMKNITSSDGGRSKRENRRLENQRAQSQRRESPRPHRPTAAKSTWNDPEYGYGAKTKSSPPRLDGEAGKAYADFMRGQQQSNGVPSTPEIQNPYSHRINEGHYYQPQPRAPPKSEQQPVGPGKVIIESDEEDDETMGQDGGMDGDAFVDGSGSPPPPRSRGGGGGDGRLEGQDARMMTALKGVQENGGLLYEHLKR